MNTIPSSQYSLNLTNEGISLREYDASQRTHMCKFRVSDTGTVTLKRFSNLFSYLIDFLTHPMQYIRGWWQGKNVHQWLVSSHPTANATANVAGGHFTPPRPQAPSPHPDTGAVTTAAVSHLAPSEPPAPPQPPENLPERFGLIADCIPRLFKETLVVRLNDEYFLAKLSSDRQSITLAPYFPDAGRQVTVSLSQQGVQVQHGNGISDDEVLHLIDEATSVAHHETYPLPPEDQNFAPASLITFRTAAIPGTVTAIAEHSYANQRIVETIGGTQYAIWIVGLPNGRFAVNIQEKHSFDQSLLSGKIGLNIGAQGQIESMYVDSIRVASLSEDQQRLLQAAFRTVLASSSSYTGGPTIYIQTVTRGPKEIPEFHLQSLVEQIRANPQSRLRVTFKRDDLQLLSAIDATGLSRSYLEGLFSGIVGLSSTTEWRSRQPRPQPPFVDKGQQIGAVLMWCYLMNQSQNVGYMIGNHLKPAALAAALSLTADEVDQGYTPQVRVNILRMIADASSKTDPHLPIGSVAQMADMDKFFGEYRTAACTPTQQAAAQLEVLDQHLTAIMGLCLDEDGMPLQWFLDSGMTKETIQVLLRKDPTQRSPEEIAFLENLKGRAQECLSSDKFWDDALEMSELNPRAIHEIARGMKGFIQPRPDQTPTTAWDAVRSDAIRGSIVDGSFKFNASVQGAFNPEAIATSIQGEGAVPPWLAAKIQWIQEWVRDPATTKDDIKKFLKWVRGSSSAPAPGQEIKISELVQHGAQEYSAPFFTHTCFSSFQIARSPYGDSHIPANETARQYETKEGFLRILKEDINRDVLTVA
jgi:hypothetical protein